LTIKKSYYAIHQDLLSNIIIAAQKRFPGIRLFERVAGVFYTKDGRVITVGGKGRCDLYGVIDINGYPVHFEIEVKSGESGIKKGSDQHRWQLFCESMNIPHVVARSVAQCLNDLEIKLNSLKK